MFDTALSQKGSSTSEDAALQLTAAVSGGSSNTTTTGSTLAIVGSASAPSWISTLSTSSIKADMTSADVGGIVSYAGLKTVFSDLAATIGSGTLTQTELTDLDTIAINLNNGVTTSAYLTYVTDALIDGNAANAKWTGGTSTSSALGNLSVGYSATQFNELVGKWFLGTDLPNSTVIMTGSTTFSVTYSTVTGSLFGAAGPTMNDINQGDLGDCFFECSLAEVAYQHAGNIQTMFTSNGNGTYGVRFYENGVATYVTVNSQLADGGSDFNYGANIWASLAEKAYAQLQASGVVTGNTSANYGNSWSSIGNGGVTMYALEEITNASQITDYYASGTSWASETINQSLYETGYSSGISTSALQSLLVSDLAAGYDLELDSNTDATDSSHKSTLVSDHAFSIYGFDTATSMFEVRNPWGIETGQTWETTFEVSLSTVLAADDDIVVDNIAATPISLPTLLLTAASAQNGSSNLSIFGQIDTADVGLAISLYDGAALIGTLTANSSGSFSDVMSIGTGVHFLTTSATNGAGKATSPNSIVALNNGTTSLGGNGNIVEFVGTTGNDNVTFSGSGAIVGIGSGLANLLINGSGETINGSSGDVISITGSSNSINVSSSTIVKLTGAGDIINGTGAVITLTSGDNNEIVNGNWHTVNVTSGNTVTINGQNDTATGTGAVVTLASGDINEIVNGNWHTVNVASGNTVAVNGQNDTVTGTGAVVTLASGDINEIVNGNWHTVNVASGNTVAVNGQNDTVTGTGAVVTLASGDINEIVNGNWHTVNVASGNTVAVNGQNDTVTGTGAVVTLASGDTNEIVNGNWHTVNVASGNTVAINGQNDTVTGTGAVVTLASGDINEIVNGNWHTVNVASGNTVAVNGQNDTVTGTGAVVTLASGDINEIVNGNWHTVNVASGNTVAVNGQNDTVTGTGAVVTLASGDTNEIVNGNWHTVNVASGNTVAINGQNDTVTGTGAVVTLASGDINEIVNGNWHTVNVTSGNAVTINGQNDTVSGTGAAITLTNGDTSFIVNGNWHTINAATADTVKVNGQNDTFVYKAGFGTSSIDGFSFASNDIISLASSEFANFAVVLADAQNSGSNVILTNGTGDSLTLLGINKSALAASEFKFHP